MHLLRSETRSLDETAPAVDLEQSRADIVALSFADTDLAVLAKAWERLSEGAAPGPLRRPTLRLASLADLRHPYSVDLYVEKVVAHARFVLVRLLGGRDYWAYGVEELARAARANGAALAFLPGDAFDDPRLVEASTLSSAELAQLDAYFRGGGPDNAEQALRFALRRLGGDAALAPPVPQSAWGTLLRAGPASGPAALVVFYRSAWLAGDTAPYEALAEALASRGFRVEAIYVTSLKDPAAAGPLAMRLKQDPPAVILNATAFSARLDDGATVFDACDAPVIQVACSLASAADWAASARGLAPADLAMNVALPEVDGRIFAGAIAFKARAERIAALEYAPQRAAPDAAGVAHAAALAAGWARLRAKPNSEKSLAFVLSDYPAKGGRTGYAVGLDTYASVAGIFAALRAEGYALAAPPADLARVLERTRTPALTLARYKQALHDLPPGFAASVSARWGEPEQDEACRDGVFHFAALTLGAALVAVQPDRGRRDARADEYHDPALPPRHGYVAFYVWLREILRADAVVHVGAHGTLEWLPGKAVALSDACAPRAVLGPVPVIYPFIVNNPGEATQAKRRIAAVTLGHLTPPLVAAAPHGATAEVEALMDEYAQARALDPRRARRLAELVLDRARDAGLADEAGLGDDPDDALLALDAWLCDLKDMRIGDGLHVYGRAEGETRGLIDALRGRHVAPGPGGAPSRGREDVLPTGRNLYAVDPRAVPTRTAYELGRRAGEAFLAAYVQERGEWPARVVLDLWGSAAMRTGGEDLGQALWLIGVRPVWDPASHRVGGYEILSPATLGRPRVDVTLRISGLFRDVFPEQIALFHAAASAVAAREDEDAADNPLRGATGSRIFGQGPGAYGTGVGRAALSGAWSRREDLGETYLAATRYAFDGGEARESDAFRARVGAAQAYLHVQDMAGQDVLDSDAFAEHEGGFAAAASALDAAPALFHLDATDPQKPKARTLARETARALRARAANPAWLKGQMRHGYRGAAEIAESVDNLYLFAATTDSVADRHFDLLFDAVCGDADVRAFLIRENPQAAAAVAERFEDALRRGLWTSRRNSVPAVLDLMRVAA